jgi:uncharacterized membrane protein YgcG
MFGRTGAQRVLLRAGAALEARDGDGATPLALAAEHGQRDAAFELLWRGADAGAADGAAGATPGAAAAAGAARPDVAALLAAWPRGELRAWSRARHAVFPAPFRADVASLLLATLGSSSSRGDAETAPTAPGAAAGSVVTARATRGVNPLRALQQHFLLEELFRALLLAHMGGPPVVPIAAAALMPAATAAAAGAVARPASEASGDGGGDGGGSGDAAVSGGGGGGSGGAAQSSDTDMP